MNADSTGTDSKAAGEISKDADCAAAPLESADQEAASPVVEVPDTTADRDSLPSETIPDSQNLEMGKKVDLAAPTIPVVCSTVAGKAIEDNCPLTPPSQR
jgi:hypothetical protein